MEIAEEKYVSVTTYRRTGEAVPTPVWIVGLADGRLGFTTGMGSGKTKRLAHDPRVTLRPCDRAGGVDDSAPTYSGRAETVQSGAAFTEVRGRVRAKYGLAAKAFGLVGRLRGRGGDGPGDAVVLITLD